MKKLHLHIYSAVIILVLLTWPVTSSHADNSDTTSLEKYAKATRELGQDKDAVRYIHEGLRIAQAEEKYNYQLFFTLKMADYYRHSEINDEAMSYYLQALGLAKMQQDTLSHAKALNGLTELYLENNMHSKASSFNSKAINMLSDSIYPVVSGKSHEIKAKLLYNEKQWHKAIEAAEKAIALYSTSGDEDGLIRQWLLIARIYSENDLQAQSVKFLNKALKRLNKVESDEVAITLYQEMATLYEESGKADSALHYWNKGLSLAKKANKLKLEAQLLSGKAQTLEKMERNNQALKAYKRHHQLQDKLDQINARENLQRLEVEYRTNREKEKNRRLRKELAEKENTRNLLILITIILSLALIALLAYRRYRKQRRVTATLESFNNELERRVAQKTRELALEMKEREKKSVEAEEARKKAEESDRLKTEFLRNISHEVRTPMNRIIGYSDLLVETSQQEDEITYASVIKKDSERLLKIITDIVELSRLASEDLQPNMEPLKLSLLIDNAKRSFVSEAPEDVTFNTETADELKNMNIVTDPERLLNILGHLVSNAFKFARPGNVTLSIHKGATTLDFTVQDDGPGIDPEKLSIIFDYFRQADGSSTRPAGGLGAGLTIAKHLTEILGGKLHIESQPEKGTTAIVSFPLKTIMKQEASKPVSNHEPTWKGKKVLIFDESNSNVKFIKAMLKKTGLEVLHVRYAGKLKKALMNGSDASLVIINYPEPKVTEELISHIKSLYYTLPVILMTSTGTFNHSQTKADEVLTLPVSYKVLLDSIRKLLEENNHL
ncbi:MAG: ATP-binding protein [Bacteroidota bacterium]